MPTPTSERVQKRRDALRAAGLRPVQMWMPDTRRPGFAAECGRQAALPVLGSTLQDPEIPAGISKELRVHRACPRLLPQILPVV